MVQTQASIPPPQRETKQANLSSGTLLPAAIILGTLFVGLISWLYYTEWKTKRAFERHRELSKQNAERERPVPAPARKNLMLMDKLSREGHKSGRLPTRLTERV